MGGRFIAGVTAGAIIGVTAGIMMSPNMDRNTKRRLRKSGRLVRDVAEDVYDGVVHIMR